MGGALLCLQYQHKICLPWPTLSALCQAEHSASVGFLGGSPPLPPQGLARSVLGRTVSYAMGGGGIQGHGNAPMPVSKGARPPSPPRQPGWPRGGPSARTHIPWRGKPEGRDFTLRNTPDEIIYRLFIAALKKKTQQKTNNRKPTAKSLLFVDFKSAFYFHSAPAGLLGWWVQEPGCTSSSPAAGATLGLGRSALPGRVPAPGWLGGVHQQWLCHFPSMTPGPGMPQWERHSPTTALPVPAHDCCWLPRGRAPMGAGQAGSHRRHSRPGLATVPCWHREQLGRPHRGSRLCKPGFDVAQKVGQ